MPTRVIPAHNGIYEGVFHRAMSAVSIVVQIPSVGKIRISIVVGAGWRQRLRPGHYRQGIESISGIIHSVHCGRSVVPSKPLDTC